MIKLIQNKKGQAALFVSISVSAILLYIGLYVANRNAVERTALNSATSSVSSFYLADMGAERFLYELKLQIAGSSSYGPFTSLEDLANNIGEVAVGDGSYKVATSGSNVKITGSYHNVSRAIELTYNP